jgi:hypothetical protein
MGLTAMRAPFRTSYSVAVVAAILFSAVFEADAVAQTSVTLTFRGPLKEPAAVTTARLLVTAWGVSEEYELPIEGNIVRLDLEATRPEFVDRIADTSGFVYVKAVGFAPVMSEAFTWPAPGVPTVIDFRNGRQVTNAQGAKTSLDVPIRPPLPRRVRLIDLDGRAVIGAELEAAAYWRTPNHCGFLNGRDVLASGSTNQDGTIDVPDLDGPYVFSLLEPQMLFADADNDYPAGFARQGLIATLSGPDTTLRVRRYDRQRLAVDIVNNGKPVPGAVLWSDMALGVCGAGYGPLATADSEGRIRMEPFFPEMWRRYWICAGGRQVWVLPHEGKLPTRIDLGVTPSAEPNALAGLCGK